MLFHRDLSCYDVRLPRISWLINLWLFPHPFSFRIEIIGAGESRFNQSFIFWTFFHMAGLMKAYGGGSDH